MSFRTQGALRIMVTNCACCGKQIKKAFIYEGKAYGLACLAELLGCTQTTVKKLFK